MKFKIAPIFVAALIAPFLAHGEFLTEYRLSALQAGGNPQEGDFLEFPSGLHLKEVNQKKGSVTKFFSMTDARLESHSCELSMQEDHEVRIMLSSRWKVVNAQESKEWGSLNIWRKWQLQHQATGRMMELNCTPGTSGNDLLKILGVMKSESKVVEQIKYEQEETTPSAQTTAI